MFTGFDRRAGRWLMLAAALLGAGGAAAHGMYVAQRHGSWEVVVGFSSNDEAYPVNKIATSTAYDASGRERPAELIVHGDPAAGHVKVDVPADAAVLVTVADYGFYARRPEAKWQPVRKRQLSGAAEGLHALKYNTLVLQPDQQGKAHGLGLEIIPLEDPLAKRRGDRLRVRLLHDGKPLPGVRLTEDFVGDDSRLTAPTDADGVTTVTLRASRLNVVAVERDVAAADDPDVDFYRYFATLSFQLNHVEPD